MGLGGTGPAVRCHLRQAPAFSGPGADPAKGPILGLLSQQCLQGTLREQHPTHRGLTELSEGAPRGCLRGQFTGQGDLLQPTRNSLGLALPSGVQPGPRRLAIRPFGEPSSEPSPSLGWADRRLPRRCPQPWPDLAGGHRPPVEFCSADLWLWPRATVCGSAQDALSGGASRTGMQGTPTQRAAAAPA